MESITSPTKRHQPHSNWIRVFVNCVHDRTGVWPLVYVSAASTRSVSVRSGDTMSGIAKRTGLWSLSAWSVPFGNINLIYPGNIVTYRGTATATRGSATTGGRVHVVKSGETLSGIFGANGWQRVAQLNNLANPNLIYPGQRIRY